MSDKGKGPLLLVATPDEHAAVVVVRAYGSVQLVVASLAVLENTRRVEDRARVDPSCLEVGVVLHNALASVKNQAYHIYVVAQDLTPWV